MKYKVSELEGALLDAAVAMAEGFPQFAIHMEDGERKCFLGPVYMDRFVWAPTDDWGHGGPIIERERISVVDFVDCWGAFHPKADDLGWRSEDAFDVTRSDAVLGPTPLIAAMRAFVASKLGDEVELP